MQKSWNASNESVSKSHPSDAAQKGTTYLPDTSANVPLGQIHQDVEIANWTEAETGQRRRKN